MAFLVKQSRVNVIDVTQYGQSVPFTNPTTGSTSLLNDRPPLILHAGVKRAGGADYPVTVIINHLRSLISIDDPATGPFVRAKREAQAEYLAALIAGFESAGEHVVSVGDYNAFEFSDGYVDVLGAIKGDPAPADQVVLASPANLTNPNLMDLAFTLDLSERWSYVENGSAQILDHVLITPDIAAGAHLTYAHLNADFPDIYYNDATRPERVSDHDGAVAYFALPDVRPAISLSSTALTFPTQLTNTTSNGQNVILTNSGNGTLDIASIAASADFAQSNSCPPALAPAANCSISVTFTPTTAGTRNGAVTINSNGTSGPGAIALTGVGASFQVSPTKLIYNRPQQFALGAIEVTNTGKQAVSGPLQVVISGLPSGISLVDAGGSTGLGPYIELPSPIRAGKTVRVPVLFHVPSKQTVNYNPILHLGNF